MTFTDLITTLNNILPDSKLSVEADLLLEDEDDISFRVLFTTNEAAFILMSFQIYFNKKMLAEKLEVLQHNAAAHMETDDIRVFIERRNTQLLPYLEAYNKQFTDYEKLAELYHETRGLINANRFGFK